VGILPSFFETKEHTMADTEVGVTRITAIACTNAVIKHLKRGLFMSELNRISESTLRFCKLAGHAQVSFEGRANTGEWIYAVNTVIFKKDRGGQFPVERVFVALHEQAREGFKDEHIYFECTFASDSIEIRKLDKSPHEESGEEFVDRHWTTANVRG
jgi:hypothetical protein